MRYKLLFSFATSEGTFYIGRSDDGRFHPVFNNESYGSYAQDWQAAEDLAAGHTFSITNPNTATRIDVRKLGIPRELAEWERVR